MWWMNFLSLIMFLSWGLGVLPMKRWDISSKMVFLRKTMYIRITRPPMCGRLWSDSGKQLCWSSWLICCNSVFQIPIFPNGGGVIGLSNWTSVSQVAGVRRAAGCSVCLELAGSGRWWRLYCGPGSLLPSMNPTHYYTPDIYCEAAWRCPAPSHCCSNLSSDDQTLFECRLGKSTLPFLNHTLLPLYLNFITLLVWWGKQAKIKADNVLCILQTLK